MVDWDDDETISYLTGSDKGCSCKKVTVHQDANVPVIKNPAQ